MLKRNALWGVLLTVALFPGWAVAQHGGHNHGGGSVPSQAAPAERTGKIKGKLVDFSDHQLTVEHEKKGGVMSMDFMIDSKTKVKGELKAGSEVVVKYREEAPGQGKIATSIEVKRSKAKGN